MNIKRIVLPAALAFASSLAFAQAPIVRSDPANTPQTPDSSAAPQASGHRHAGQHHDRNPHKEALKLSQKLNLTPDQTAKLEPVLADREQKMAALKGNTALTPGDRHQQAKAIHQSTESQLAGILTPDQLQQLKSMHRDHGHHRGNHQSEPAPSGL